MDAKSTNRRVWAIEGGRHCDPCFRLARWIDDRQELLNQDHIFVKVNAYLDVHGEDVAKRIRQDEYAGIPFHAIFDTGEKMRINRDGPIGNIGHPSDYDGKKHLRKMLETTCQRLVPGQIDVLVKSLDE